MTTTLICNNMTSVTESISCITSIGTYNGIPLVGLIIISLLWIALFWRSKDTEGTKNAIVGASWFSAIIAMFMMIIGFFGTWGTKPIAFFVVLSVASIITIINRN